MNVTPRKARLAVSTIITARGNLSRHEMTLLGRISLLLIILICVENQIYLQETNDGLSVEFFDCVLVQSLLYCRRPEEPFDLSRENDITLCHLNGGQLHRFSELHSKNISVSTVLHRWKSSLERVDQYARFRRGGVGEWDGYVCQCVDSSSFGKNCEYRLPMGKTFAETLHWQLAMRMNSSNQVQMFGEIVCYQRVACDSGLLCLDWREICDGVQQCMSAVDEENCDLLEMNRCDPEEEYRCMNGMCIPEEFFLDGEFDCLDWSDELQFKEDHKCSEEGASDECDDRVCPPQRWSCGDGQCIEDRLAFQKGIPNRTCHSRRDQHFICEAHGSAYAWTMANGRCFENEKYHESRVVHDNKEQLCEYLLKCVLSLGHEEHCPCDKNFECVDDLKRECPLSFLQYPRGALLSPSMFLIYDLTGDVVTYYPNFVLINGTVRCRGFLLNVTRTISFERDLNVRELIEELFCTPARRNISSAENVDSEQQCHRANESSDRCEEWNPCMSSSRVRDGWINCLNGRDELDQTEMEIERNCGHVRAHRFRCSLAEPTCLSVMTLGNQLDDCQNRFDEVWFGNGRKLLEIHCNERVKDECSLLRQYIAQSWTSNNRDERRVERHIPFRFYCDTLANLASREDEDLAECRRWWVCPEEKWRCLTGQCLDKEWILDHDWDCADASDEHPTLIAQTQSILRRIFPDNSSNQSSTFPTSCNESHSFLCPSPRVSSARVSCITLDQIGDDHIDCAGAIDERNTFPHCSHSTATLEYNFLCPSTKSCIPYSRHCQNNTRCHNRSDDETWCERPNGRGSLITPIDAVCFDGQLIEDGRCNRIIDCFFGEDEYMCEHWGFSERIPDTYREGKESLARSAHHILRLSRYPTDVNVTLLNSDSLSGTEVGENSSSSSSSSSLSPFWCNRGLGALLRNGSIVCFCPPQYRGEKCQYQTDRLSLLLSLDLSPQSAIDSTTVLRVLLLFLFANQTLLTQQFHLRPALDITSHSLQRKIRTHFLYPRSSSFGDHRVQRLTNRSSLLHTHPYSIRIEIYETRRSSQPVLVAVWRYPIFFDHLPVFRLAKILRFPGSVDQHNPCSSRPCSAEHEECHSLINDPSNYLCLCKANFTGKNCSQVDSRCLHGFCALGSLCKGNERGLLRGVDSVPLCLCPADRSGARCEIEADVCLSHPCLNNGSCFAHSQLTGVICLCTEEYFGKKCEERRPYLRLSLAASSSYVGAVLQYFHLDSTSLHLILVVQQVFPRLPRWIEFYADQTILPEIILAKVYSSSTDSSPDLYLLSSQQNAISLQGRTEISEINRCPHLRTFSNGNSSSFSPAE